MPNPIVISDGVSLRVESAIPGRFDTILAVRGEELPDGVNAADVKRLTDAGALGTAEDLAAADAPEPVEEAPAPDTEANAKAKSSHKTNK